MTVSREEAIKQLEIKEKSKLDTQVYYINENIKDVLKTIFGFHVVDEYGQGRWHDVQYGLYNYRYSNNFIAQFKYDSFQFKLKVRPGERGSSSKTLYIKTKYRWHKVDEASQILLYVKQGKLPESK